MNPHHSQDGQAPRHKNSPGAHLSEPVVYKGKKFISHSLEVGSLRHSTGAWPVPLATP
jgi:hypothetical protein